MPRIVVVGSDSKAIAKGLASLIPSNIDVITTDDRGVAYYNCTDDTAFVLAGEEDVSFLTRTFLLAPLMLPPSEEDQRHKYQIPIFECVKSEGRELEEDKMQKEAIPEKYKWRVSELISGRVSWQELADRAEEYRRSPPERIKEEVSLERELEVRKAVDSATLSVLDFSAAELELAVVMLLSPHSETLQISPERLKYFVSSVRSLYRDSPYHCWFHAVDVVHFMTKVLLLPPIAQLFSPIEIVTAILAGLVHDIDHDGITNKGHSALDSDRHKFAGKATQEKHHLAIAHRLFYSARINNYINNEILTTLIEATDMATHNSHFQAFQRIADEDRPKFIGNYENRTLLLLIIMKAADLSNTVRKVNTSRIWGELLGKEFKMAYDREVEANVPSERQSFHGDPSHSHDKLQLNFFKNIIVPFFTLLSKNSLLAEFMTPLVQNGQNAVNHFQDLFDANPSAADTPIENPE